MTKRDVMNRALSGEPVPYTPWSIGLTREADQKLKAHVGDADWDEYMGAHICKLGSGIGYFEAIGDDRFKDIFGVEWDRSVEKDIGMVANQVLPEPTVDGLVLPDPDDPIFFKGAEEKLKRYGDRYRTFNIGFSLYERAWALRGMEDLMMDFIINKDFVHDLLTKIADFNIALVKHAIEYDIDAVHFGDDWGQQSGLQMGYDLWKEFIYPQLKRTYAIVKDAGKRVTIHSCGDVDELFDDLVDIGLNCFNPFQPEVMDVEALHAQYHGRLAFWGGLSTQRTLPYGTVNDVVEETQRLIDMGRRGGYVFAPAHSVEGDVPVENLIAVLDTLKAQEGYHGAKVRQHAG